MIVKRKLHLATLCGDLIVISRFLVFQSFRLGKDKSVGNKESRVYASNRRWH